MASKLTVIARYDGVSSTGSSHGLLIETAGDGTVRFTVTGHDGKKRHAAVTLPDAVVSSMLDTLYLRDNVVSPYADDDDYCGPAWEEQDV